MNGSDMFSYKMTVTNEGILPVFRTDWAVAPKILAIRATANPVEKIAGNGFVIYPGGAAIGPEDFAFHLRRSDTARAGTLTPGDGYTFTTEGLIASTPGAVADTVDFAIAVDYVPVFPPVPMETCSHFRIYQDRQGTQHWFRLPNRCNRFPWLHHWFDKPGPRSDGN